MPLRLRVRISFNWDPRDVSHSGTKARRSGGKGMRNLSRWQILEPGIRAPMIGGRRLFSRRSWLKNDRHGAIYRAPVSTSQVAMLVGLNQCSRVGCQRGSACRYHALHSGGFTLMKNRTLSEVGGSRKQREENDGQNDEPSEAEERRSIEWGHDVTLLTSIDAGIFCSSVLCSPTASANRSSYRWWLVPIRRSQ